GIWYGEETKCGGFCTLLSHAGYIQSLSTKYTHWVITRVCPLGQLCACPISGRKNMKAITAPSNIPPTFWTMCASDIQDDYLIMTISNGSDAPRGGTVSSTTARETITTVSPTAISAAVAD